MPMIPPRKGDSDLELAALLYLLVFAASGVCVSGLVFRGDRPVLRLWHSTGKDAYLSFADYIVRVGASTKGVSIFELAYRDEMPPFRYPVVKAYEVMSCFEGLVEYYRVTGEEKWKTAASRGR